MTAPARACAAVSRDRGVTLSGLILSIFPGVDLLGRGFEAAGFCVVRGPDPLWGGRIESFHPPPATFQGVIGGPPCTEFSLLKRQRNRPEGVRLLREFLRVVKEADPVWFLLENVAAVPDVALDGYEVDRFDLRAADVGLGQRRLRHFQFGRRDGSKLHLERPRADPAAALNPAVTAHDGRDFAELLRLTGLPADYDLPAFKSGAKKRAVGNGVPPPMAEMIALAIKTRSPHFVVCVCGCGRPVARPGLNATVACRKRRSRAKLTPREIVRL